MKFNKNRCSIKEKIRVYTNIFFCNSCSYFIIKTVEGINRLMHSEQDNTRTKTIRV